VWGEGSGEVKGDVCKGDTNVVWGVVGERADGDRPPAPPCSSIN